MLRIIVRTDNATIAANLGGSVLAEYRTFDVSLPEVERALRVGHSLSHTQVVGVELIEPLDVGDPPAPTPDPF